MEVFTAIHNLLLDIFHFFADMAQDFVAMGHKAAAYPGFGQAIAIFLYSVADFTNWIATAFKDWAAAWWDLQVIYISWTDGSMLHDLFQTVVTLLVDEYGEPSAWIKREITELMPMLGRAIFEEENNYALDFWDQMYNVLLFFYEPGRIVPYLVGLYNLEWRRLFDDPLGWLYDRLMELDLPWSALPDDILAWLWDWLLTTAEDTFTRIVSPFRALASKMLRYLIEGEFAE